MTVNNTGIPVISGSAVKGQTLVTSDGTWTFDDDYLTYAYQWLRCDTLGDNCVPIGGATAASYLLVTADVGSTIRSEVTATEHVGPTPPPPGPGQALTWTPPGYPSYSGYQVRTIDMAHLNHTVTPGTNVDAVFNWTEVINNNSGENRVVISGFRNVVIIGGERNNSNAKAFGNGAGLQIDKCNGIVHLEGIKLAGAGQMDCFVFTSGPKTGGQAGADVRMQNCYARNNRIGDIHCDGIQLWSSPGQGFNGGLRSLKTDRLTIHSTYQGIFLGTHDGVIQDFDLRNSNLVGVPRQTNGTQDGMGWIFFKGCYPDVGGFYGTGSVSNFYIDNSERLWTSYVNMVTPGSSGGDGSGGQPCSRANQPARVCTQGTDGVGTFINWANSSSDIKGKMYIDRPPLGVGGLASSPSTALGDTDFCPPTVPGISYVSPGYI